MKIVKWYEIKHNRHQEGLVVLNPEGEYFVHKNYGINPGRFIFTPKILYEKFIGHCLQPWEDHKEEHIFKIDPKEIGFIDEISENYPIESMNYLLYFGK